MTTRPELPDEAGGIPPVQANYIDGVLPEYRGNPFIEALPTMPSNARLLKTLAERPPYEEAERQLPANVRAHCVLRLFDYFEPLSRNVDAAQRLDLLMRSGYRKRSPSKPEFRARLNEIYLLSQRNAIDGSLLASPAPSMSMSLIGVSGTGKTRSLRRALASYPQRIVHPRYGNHHQIPWLIVECPHDGSVKQLCLSFFLAVDRVLGTNYAVTKGGARQSVVQRVLDIAQISRLHGIGIIIIDELQHLRPAGPDGITKMLNFLVAMVNLSEAAIVLVGTMGARDILQSDFRQARRGAGLGSLVWPRMERDKEWDYIIERLWKYQWTREPAALTPELKSVIYSATQGVIDLAVKLYMLSQYRAMATKVETLNPELMQQVADEDFALLRPMLDALRSGDPLEIARYDDLRPLDFEQLLARENLRIGSGIDIDALLRAAEEDVEVRRAQTLSALMAVGVSPASAELAANVAFDSNKTITAAQALKKGLSLVEGGRGTKTTTNTNKRGGHGPSYWAALEDSDLRKIVFNAGAAGEDPVEALIAGGAVTSPDRLFAMGK